MSPIRLMRLGFLRLVLLLVGLLAMSCFNSALADIADFTTWRLVEDPAHPDFSASATADAVSLNANGGPIPAGTDIGYQSVNGDTVASSDFGHAFDPLFDFALAIDFSLSFSNSPDGYLGIGFGIGEDIDGQNSAGVALLFNNGVPSPFFGAAARINDATQTPMPIVVSGSLTGSMFASYDASNGDVTLGASASPGAAIPAGTATYGGIQQQWSGTNLLASMFLRSDNTLGTPWQSGDAEAVFSNFRVLSGSPYSLSVPVPVPAPVVLIGFGLLAMLPRHRPRGKEVSASGQGRKFLRV